MKQLHIYITNHKNITHFKKSAAKKFYFLTTSGKNSAKFEDFQQGNCTLMKLIAKNQSKKSSHKNVCHLLTLGIMLPIKKKKMLI